MKKEILYRLIEEVVKESEDYNLEDLLKILRPLEAKDEYAYEMFASLIEDVLSEEPLRGELEVTRVRVSDGSVTIYFNSDEKMQSFVEILKSEGLKEWRPSVQPLEYHFKTQRQRKKYGPYIIFSADNYYDDED